MSNRRRIKRRVTPRCHGPMTTKTTSDENGIIAWVYVCEVCGRYGRLAHVEPAGGEA